MLAIIAGLLSNGGNFLSRFILREGDDPSAFAWFSELFRAILFGIVAIFDWHLVVSLRSIFLLLACGLAEAVAIYFWMQMHRLSHLSISSLLGRTRLIWIALFAFFLASERLRLVDYVGILILFIGISVAIAPRHLVRDAGMKAAAYSAIFIALGTVIYKLLLPYASVAVIQGASFLPAIVIFPLLMPQAKSRLMNSLRKGISLKAIAVGVIFISNYIYTYALKFGEVSKITGVYQGMVVVAVLAGIIFLKERENIPRKIIGTAIVLGGVLLLS